MANNADVEAVDFEPEDDDLMDEDGAVDAEPSASPRAPLHKLKSAITGSASLSAPKKTKGRGFREDPNAERNTRLAVSDLDGLHALDGLEPQRCKNPLLPRPFFLLGFGRFGVSTVLVSLPNFVCLMRFMFHTIFRYIIIIVVL